MRLYVERAGKKARTFCGEWLKGETSRAEMEVEARALLADPKDSIVRVKVWDDRWMQFEPVTYV